MPEKNPKGRRDLKDDSDGLDLDVPSDEKDDIKFRALKDDLDFGSDNDDKDDGELRFLKDDQN